jgi:hypothetical protein
MAGAWVATALVLTAVASVLALRSSSHGDIDRLREAW